MPDGGRITSAVSGQDAMYITVANSGETAIYAVHKGLKLEEIERLDGDFEFLNNNSHR